MMTRTTPIRIAAAGVVLALAVSACGGEVSGSPAGPAFSPPDPSTATARAIDLDEALAVSPDSTRIAVVEDEKLCIRARVPSGAAGTAAVCSDTEFSGQQSAAFSPSGNRVVVFANVMTAAGRGGARIMDGSSGTTVPITLPEPPRPSSSQGPTTTSTKPTNATGSLSRVPTAAFLWQSDDSLFAVGIAGAVYRVTPSTGNAVLVTPGGDRSEEFVDRAALGGGTIALVMRKLSRGGTRLVTVAVADDTVRDPAVAFEQGVDQPVLMGVSPDGTKALLSTANLQTAVPGETRLYDLTSGDHLVVPGTERTMAAGGAFSPDGSVVAFVAASAGKDGTGVPERAADGDRWHLQLAPADGSRAPRDLVGADDTALNVYGPLLWSPAGVVITTAGPSRQASAWTVSG